MRLNLTRPKTQHEPSSHSQDKAAATLEHSTRSPAWTAALPLQPKLTINQPGDAYEQEADHVAEQVIRMPAPSSLQRRCACGGIAGADGECAACKAKRLGLQRRAAGNVPTTEAPPSVHQTLSHPGQPLDTGTRSFMESRFGQDFSGVRVHRDSQAEQSAADVNARAFTVGSDVVFGAGEYAPGTSEGQRLIAHELTHVGQQSAGREFVARDPIEATDEQAGESTPIRGELDPIVIPPILKHGEGKPAPKSGLPCDMKTTLLIMTGTHPLIKLPALLYRMKGTVNISPGVFANVTVEAITELPSSVTANTDVLKAVDMPGKTLGRYSMEGRTAGNVLKLESGDIKSSNMSMRMSLDQGPSYIHFTENPDDFCRATTSTLTQTPPQVKDNNTTPKPLPKLQTPEEKQHFKDLPKEEKANRFWEKLWEDFTENFSWVHLLIVIGIAAVALVVAFLLPELFLIAGAFFVGFMIAKAVFDLIERLEKGEYAEAIVGFLKDLALIVAMVAGMLAVATLVVGGAIIAGLSAGTLAIIAVAATVIALLLMGVMILLKRNEAVDSEDEAVLDRKAKEGGETLQEMVDTIVTLIISFIGGKLMPPGRLPTTEPSLPGEKGGLPPVKKGGLPPVEELPPPTKPSVPDEKGGLPPVEELPPLDKVDGLKGEQGKSSGETQDPLPKQTEPPSPKPAPIDPLQQKIVDGEQQLGNFRKSNVEKIAQKKQLQQTLDDSVKLKQDILAKHQKSQSPEEGQKLLQQAKEVQQKINETTEKINELNEEIGDNNHEIGKVTKELDNLRNLQQGRVKQDIDVDPDPPPNNDGNSTIGTTPNQDLQLKVDIAAARNAGAADIRVNQEQVNAGGKRIGINKPDLQYTIGKQRYYVEYEQPGNPRGMDHVKRILANDPTAKITVKLIPTQSGFTPGKGVTVQTFP
jgi:hypothetical protein